MPQLKIQSLVAEFLHYLQHQKSSSKLTLKAYALDLTQAFNAEVKTVNSQDLLSFARRAQTEWGGLSLSSRNRKTATLKSFLGWLFDTQQIEKPLAELLVGPKPPKKLPDFISVDEVLTILSLYEKRKNLDAKNYLQNTKELVLFVLLYGGGLRISEACQLKWNDINNNLRSLRIKGKGNKERLVVLPHFCVDKVNELKALGTTPYVFGEAPLNSRTGYEWIRKMGVKAQLLHSLHPHSLRHSFATHMLASGANLRTLQKLLGHESLQATERYTHLNVDQLARTLESKHPLSKIKFEK